MARKKVDAKTPINHIHLVIDQSTSMGSLVSQMNNLYKNLVDTLKQRSIENNQQTFLGLTYFHNSVNCIFSEVPIKQVSNNLGYYVQGSTALFDAIGKTIDLMSTVATRNDEDHSFLLIGMTDGEENSSILYNATKLKKRIEQVEALGNWTVTFQVPPKAYSPGISADAFASRFGFARGNVTEWEASVVGTQRAEAAVNQAVGNYLTARSTGKKAVDNFYVGVDLSGVSKTTVKKKLKDVSAKYRIYEVPKEVAIKEFVESKTGKPFIIGSALYELTKKELIQHNKDIVVGERDSSALYGGDEARQLIGLPIGANAKVDPIMLGQFRVWAKSTSVNRRLVRGTKLLLDLTKTTHDNPTWGNLQDALAPSK